LDLVHANKEVVKGKVVPAEALPKTPLQLDKTGRGRASKTLKHQASQTEKLELQIN
jgi:hypothetical protein